MLLIRLWLVVWEFIVVGYSECTVGCVALLEMCCLCAMEILF